MKRRRGGPLAAVTAWWRALGSMRGEMRLTLALGLMTAALAIALFTVRPGPGGEEVPRASAAVGSIQVTSVTLVSGNTFAASGTWDPSGNQCWTPGQGGKFHYFIDL